MQVVEAGSLTAAAARLGVAKTLVSAHLRKLEQELGTSLLLRSTRRLSLTEAGEAFYAASRRIADEAEAAIAAAASAGAEPRGSLRVSATIDYAAAVLAPLAVRLQQRHPGLRIELLTSDRPADLLGEQLDLAIRIGRLSDSAHRATRIGSYASWLVAAPALFAGAAPPEDPEALAALPFLALSVLPQPLNWTLRHQADGRSQALRLRAALSFNTAFVLHSAALAGGGLAVLPDYMVARDVAAGRLLRLLPQWALPDGGIHAIYPGPREPPRKVRLLIDALRAQAEARANEK